MLEASSKRSARVLKERCLKNLKCFKIPLSFKRPVRSLSLQKFETGLRTRTLDDPLGNDRFQRPGESQQFHFFPRNSNLKTQSHLPGTHWYRPPKNGGFPFFKKFHFLPDELHSNFWLRFTRRPEIFWLHFWKMIFLLPLFFPPSNPLPKLFRYTLNSFQSTAWMNVMPTWPVMLSKQLEDQIGFDSPFRKEHLIRCCLRTCHVAGMVGFNPVVAFNLVNWYQPGLSCSSGCSFN